MIIENNKKKENPFISLLFNIIIPVIVLKNGGKWIDNLLIEFSSKKKILPDIIIEEVPSVVFAVALIFPFFYFFYDLLKRKNLNYISILGFINVLLTGGIGIFGAKVGLSKNWFILKEGLLPIVIGTLFFLMSKFKPSSFNDIILNDALFDTGKLKESISDEMLPNFDGIIQKAGYYLISGFFISSIIQFILAYFIVVANPGEIGFNEQVSTMTWVSYFAVMVPTILVIGKGYLSMISELETISSLDKEEFLKT